MVLRMKNLNILGVHWRTRLLGGGGFTKNQYRGGELPKKGTVCQFKGAWQERGGGVFEGELIPQCTLCKQQRET